MTDEKRTPVDSKGDQTQRKEYQPPELTVHGDLRVLTRSMSQVGSDLFGGSQEPA